MEYQSQPYSSHVEVPYDLEQLGAYTMSHHLVRVDVQYDDIVSLPQLVYQSHPVMDRSSLREHIPVLE